MINYLDLILFSIVLSVDSFSAAVALGFRRFSPKRSFFFAFSSGFSEGMATAIGFVLGHFAQNLIIAYDHWVAFFLLLLVGGHMCYQAYQEITSEDDAEEVEVKVHSWLKIIFISCVTSIDSLGVGVSLGLMNKPIAIYSLFIGLGAFLSTYIGLFLAKKISGHLGSRIEFLGGIILMILGVKMLSM